MSRSRLRHFPFTLHMSPFPGFKIEYVDVIEVPSCEPRTSIASKNIHLIADQSDRMPSPNIQTMEDNVTSGFSDDIVQCKMQKIARRIRSNFSQDLTLA